MRKEKTGKSEGVSTGEKVIGYTLYVIRYWFNSIAGESVCCKEWEKILKMDHENTKGVSTEKKVIGYTLFVIRSLWGKETVQ